MPSQNNTSLAGFNRAISGRQENVAKTLFKGDSRVDNSGLIATTNVYRPSGFTGSSNVGITYAVASGVGPSLGLPLGYAIAASGFGSPSHDRKLGEVRTANLNVANQDGIHNKQYDRVGLVQGTGINRLRDGRYIGVTGGIYTNSSGFATVTGSYIMTSASGTAGYGDNAATPGRLRAQNYLLKQGASNNKLNLPLRTQ